MGIVNVTPDSFADGGDRLEPARAMDDALGMVDAGADILDVGGESTRPGADPVSAAEELERVLPVVDALTGTAGVPVSIDTYKADVARAALERGATIVNDISGLRYDPALADVVAARGAALVLAHTRGRSREMYREATYVDLARELVEELSWSVERAMAAGVPPQPAHPGSGSRVRKAGGAELCRSGTTRQTAVVGSADPGGAVSKVFFELGAW